MARTNRPVQVVGVGMIPFTKPGASDPYPLMGANAARAALQDAGVDDVTAEKFIVDGDNICGGRVVTSPSGGLLSKGHPLGATGLAQCTELVWQLRGRAGQRQVDGARVAPQHNLGRGGACVVTLYTRA